MTHMVKVVVKWRTCDDGLDGCDMLVQDGTVVSYGNLVSKDGILVLNGIVAQIGTLVLNGNWNGILVWGASGILVLDGIGVWSEAGGIWVHIEVWNYHNCKNGFGGGKRVMVMIMNGLQYQFLPF